MRRGGAPATHVAEEGGPRGIRQRQEQWDPGLLLRNSEQTSAPINSIEREGGDLTRPQAVRRDEEEHCVIPETLRGRPVDRAKKRAYSSPGEASRQLLEPIDSWGIKLLVQPRPDHAAPRQEPEETPEPRYCVLEAAAAETSASAADEGLDVSRRDARKARRRGRICEVVQKGGGRRHMLVDGPRRETAQITQHRGVGVRERLDPARRCGLGGRQPCRLLGELQEPTNARRTVRATPAKLSPADFQVSTGNVAPLTTSSSAKRTVDSPERPEVVLAGATSKPTPEQPRMEIVGVFGQILDQRMQERVISVGTEAVKPDAEKLRRAAAWSSLVEGGRIYFGPGQNELTSAMLSVPPANPREGAVWDLVDAAGLVIRSFPTRPPASESITHHLKAQEGKKLAASYATKSQAALLPDDTPRPFGTPAGGRPQRFFIPHGTRLDGGISLAPTERNRQRAAGYAVRRNRLTTVKAPGRA